MLTHTERKISIKLIFIFVTGIAIGGYGTGVAHGVCAGGVLLNHDFETGTTDNWAGYSDGFATFSAVSPGKDSSYAAKFSITTEGGDVKVYQSGFDLQPDTNYKLTFDAYSNTGQNLRVLLSKDSDGYDNYGIDRVFDLTESWNGHGLEFTTPGSPTNAQLTFRLADWDSSGGEYFFDNICLRKAEDIVCQDNDGDGYGNLGDSTCANGSTADCDDNDNTTYPGAPEICDNKDNDCNGSTDEGCIDVTTPVVNAFNFTAEGSVEISWDVSDAGGSHLARIEIWRSPETAPDPTPEPSPISPSMANPMYWEYNSKPVLLIGGSDLDNLFQWDGTVSPWPDGTSITEHLDLLQSNGGNYIRNTISSRSYEPSDDDNPLRYNELPYPFKMINGKYDLGQWNSMYWQKLDTLLIEARERDIIVQIEIWDRYTECCHDLKPECGWYYSPWNPNNNINYDWSDSELLITGWISPYNYFHMAAAVNDPVLLPYQQNFIRKIIDTVVEGNYNNVLFQIDNESGIGDSSLEPDPYWAEFIHEYAASRGREVYVTASRRFHEPTPYFTTTFQDWNNPEIFNVILDPVFNFLDISQNNGNPGEIQYDNLVWYRDKVIENGRRPINNVKAYYMNWPTGFEFRDRTEGNDAEAGSKMWRAVFGGAASFRFHRNSPTLGTISQNGLGLSELGRTHIRSMGMFRDEVHLFSMVPSNGLLTQREADEAYCLAEEGKQAAVFFTGHGDHSIQLDVSSIYEDDLKFRWLDVASSRWNPDPTIHQGPDVITLTSPDSGHWVAFLERPEPLNTTELVDLKQNITAQNTDAHTGQATDYPPNGTWRYGLRIFDQAGNCITEENKDCSTGETNGHPAIEPLKISAFFGCTGHFDQDGDVDGGDLAIFFAELSRGQCISGDDCVGDYNGDGFVGPYDLNMFSSYFGQSECLLP